MKDIISQSELDAMHLNSEDSLEQDVKNLVILIHNELVVLEKDINLFTMRHKKSLKRKLLKIINEIVNLRKPIL